MWSHWLQSRSTRPLIHQGSIPSSFDWRYCDSLHFKIHLLDIIRKPCTASTTLLSGTNVKLNVDALIMHRRLFSAEAKTFCDFFFSLFFKISFLFFFFFNTKLFQAPEKVQVGARKLEHLQKKVDTATESSFLPEQTVMHGRWVGQTISLSRSIEIYKETGTYVWWCLNLQTRMWSWVLGSNWRNKTVTESCCTSRHQHTARLVAASAASDVVTQPNPFMLTVTAQEAAVLFWCPHSDNVSTVLQDLALYNLWLWASLLIYH